MRYSLLLPLRPLASRFTLLLSAGMAVSVSASTLIMNAVIIDGSGAPPEQGSVRISDSRIVAKGDLILIIHMEGNWYKGILQQSKEYPITGVAKLVPKNFLRDITG